MRKPLSEESRQNIIRANKLRAKKNALASRIQSAKQICEEMLFDPTLEELQNAVSKADSLLEALRPIADRYLEFYASVVLKK